MMDFNIKKKYKRPGNYVVKDSARFILKFALPPFSPLLPSLMQFIKGTELMTPVVILKGFSLGVFLNALSLKITFPAEFILAGW